jgi:hypothetical protein
MKMMMMRMYRGRMYSEALQVLGREKEKTFTTTREEVQKREMQKV